MTGGTFENPWRAGVQQDWARGNIRFCLVAPGPSAVVVTGISSARGVEADAFDDGAMVEHWLSLPDAAGRALLDALAEHYGGTGDTRQMRRDLDAERARVDKLTDAVVAIATRAGGV